VRRSNLKDRLFVYYGGADMVVCVATAKMDEFMLQLSYEHEPVQVVFQLIGKCCSKSGKSSAKTQDISMAMCEVRMKVKINKLAT